MHPRRTTNLAHLYDAPDMPWSRAAEALGSGPLAAETAQFLGTVRPDGRPHAAGVGAATYDGDVYFTSGPGTRKAKDLAANPACTLSLRLDGIDLVLEGEAVRVADEATLQAVVALYNASGWPATVDREAEAFTGPFSAPSAGPPPWHLYRLQVATAFGVATREPHGASRWDME